MDDKSRIIEAFISINQYFEDNNIDNKLLVLDFSHFTKIDDNHSNIKAEFYGFKEQVTTYNKALQEAAKKMDFWLRFEEDNVELIDNYGKNSTPSQYSYDLLEKTDSKFYFNKNSANTFKTEIVTHTLINKVGRCMLFVSKAFNNDEAQSIIYATLENPVDLPETVNYYKNGNANIFNYKTSGKYLSEESGKLVDYCFQALRELLLNEMIHSLYEIGLEKERQSTFNNIWHNTSHLIGAIRSRAIGVEEELKKYSPDYFNLLSNKLSTDLEFCMSQMNFLRNIHDLGEKGRYYFDANGEIRNEINIENVFLKNFIKGITNDLKINIEKHKADTIRPSVSMYQKLCDNIPGLYSTEGINESFTVKIEKHALYNILIDILVNATKAACTPQTNNPKIVIWTTFQDINNKIDLHIRNESGIGKKEWNYWMTGRQGKSVESHLGIRLAKHILDYYHIAYNIPESCISENGGSYTEIVITFEREYIPKLKF